MARGKLDETNVENSSYDNGTSGLTATDMKAAIDELVTLLAGKLPDSGDLSLTVSFQVGNTSNENKLLMPTSASPITIESGTGPTAKSTTLFDAATIDIAFDGGATEYIVRKGGATATEDIITKGYFDAQNVVVSDITGVTGASEIVNMIKLTQDDYDAIVTKDPDTFYLITDASTNYDYIAISCSGITENLAVGITKGYFRMPYAATVNSVKASVTTAPTGANLNIDINETGSSILSTKLVIDTGDKTSVGSATTPIFSDTSLADDAEITIDIDQVGSTVAGAGLIVYLELIKN